MLKIKNPVVLINGPPGSGKDTLGKILVDHCGPSNASILKFAQPIRGAAMSIFPGLSEVNFEGWKNQDTGLRKSYNSLSPNGNIITQEIPVKGREWMISFSEDFMKQYGQDVFAKILLETIGATSCPLQTFVITDCGFQVEVDYLADRLEKFAIIQVHRDGHSFDGDSRQSVFCGTDKTWACENNGSLDDLKQWVDKFYPVIKQRM